MGSFEPGALLQRAYCPDLAGHSRNGLDALADLLERTLSQTKLPATPLSADDVRAVAETLEAADRKSVV